MKIIGHILIKEQNPASSKVKPINRCTSIQAEVNIIDIIVIIIIMRHNHLVQRTVSTVTGIVIVTTTTILTGVRATITNITTTTSIRVRKAATTMTNKARRVIQNIIDIITVIIMIRSSPKLSLSYP